MVDSGMFGVAFGDRRVRLLSLLFGWPRGPTGGWALVFPFRFVSFTSRRTCASPIEDEKKLGRRGSSSSLQTLELLPPLLCELRWSQ